MTQTGFPYLFMRAGTSRGPYFRQADLPQDRETLSRFLVCVMGAGHPHNIDGLGGGIAVTTKVAMIERSREHGVDIDYFFAQVGVAEPLVDYRPTCGNMLVGVGPAAIEMGLMPVAGDRTPVVIRLVNTGALVRAVVQTPRGEVDYQGSCRIDGVPGTAAPVSLSFLDVVGKVCGSMLPTGHARETIDGVDVTCMDVAMPMVIARAADFGFTGHESPAAFDADRAFLDRMERIRRQAGHRMGLGDVQKAVVPKFGLLAAPRSGGTISARYFMPWTCHPTMAVTGSQCIAAAVLLPGSVAEGLSAIDGKPATVRVEHPSGAIDVAVDYDCDAEGLRLRSTGLVRTARLIARGEVMVPSDLLATG